MGIATDLADRLAADARLIILRELAAQVDGRLNEILLQRVLDIMGVRRDRDWLKTQLGKLASLGAVELTEAGTLTIAAITRDGRDHLEQRAVLSGVSRPHEVE